MSYRDIDSATSWMMSRMSSMPLINWWISSRSNGVMKECATGKARLRDGIGVTFQRIDLFGKTDCLLRLIDQRTDQVGQVCPLRDQIGVSVERSKISLFGHR